MIRTLLLAAGILAIATCNSLACDSDKIKTVDGATIVLQSGNSFDTIRDLDALDMDGWDVGDTVTVCAGTMVVKGVHAYTLTDTSHEDDAIDVIPTSADK
jgi:hypothetical protein